MKESEIYRLSDDNSDDNGDKIKEENDEDLKEPEIT